MEYIRRHKMYTRVSRETCLRETGKAPIKTGCAERDKGQPGKPNVRARWVAKEYKTHARQELHAPTPPLEALKVALSEIATGTCKGKVVALVDARRVYFYAPARRRVFVELPPEDYQPGDEHVCGLLRYCPYGTRDAAQIWEEELATTLSSLKLTRGSACSCEWRGHIKGEDIVATAHGDDITIGGERSAVEFFVRLISNKYEKEKQVTGEDPDFEKGGRTLNRVVECGRHHNRGGSRGTSGRYWEVSSWSERIRSATPRAVERKDEGKGESRRGQGQTETEHEWDNANNSD